MVSAIRPTNVSTLENDAHSASARQWSLVPESATIGWTAHKKYFMVVPVTARGRFDEFSATISMPDGDPERATARIQVQAASQNSNQGMRDKHLLRPDFFDADSYPLVTFESTSIRAIPSSADGYEVSGMLTARGATVPITLTGILEPGPGNDCAHVALSGTFNRRDFGMTWNAVPLMTLNDDISLHVEVDLERA